MEKREWFNFVEDDYQYEDYVDPESEAQPDEGREMTLDDKVDAALSLDTEAAAADPEVGFLLLDWVDFLAGE